MDQFGEESRIPYLNIEEGDVGVLISFPIIGLLIAGLTGVDSLSLPFVVGGLGFGFAVIYVSPDHVNAWTWTKDVYRYIKRPQVTFNAPAEADSETNETIRNEGGTIFRELLEEYQETRPKEMRERGTQQMRYYIGVEVTPLEVYDRFRDEGTPAEKLTQFPVIGFLFNPFVTRREDFTDVERRVKMFEKLDSRVNDIQTEFIQQASGWSARRLSTVELFVLNMDFWNGREHDQDEAAHVVRKQPIIGHSRREDETNV